MLSSKLKSFFLPGRERLVAAIISEVAKPAISLGYHLPASATELLATPVRQQWLQSLWDYSSLPKELYRQYYLTPLERCVTLMQQFPLAETGPHASAGGMVDYMLETLTYAARLSKSYMLPVGAPPEEQAAQSAAWNAVVVYAAMLSSLEHLCHLHVGLESGKRWFPLLDAPPEPYRFRFEPEPSPERLQSFGAMLAWKIIPPEAINWLSSWPEAIRTLSTYLTGFRAQSGVVNAIVSEAIRLSQSADATSIPAVPSLHFVTALSSPDLAGALLPSDNMIPAALDTELLTGKTTDSACELISVPDTEPLPAAHSQEEPDDTDMLLSMMGMGYDGIDTVVEPDSQDSGDAFWKWLVAGCRSGSLAVNKPDARVHLVAGFVFLRTPGIFHQFMSETGADKEDKAQLQRLFEKLGHHRQDNGSMYACHLYQNELHEGRFQKLNGYLVLASKIFAGDNIPENNSLLIVI